MRLHIMCGTKLCTAFSLTVLEPPGMWRGCEKKHGRGNTRSWLLDYASIILGIIGASGKHFLISHVSELAWSAIQDFLP